MTTMGERFTEEEVDEIIKEVDKDGDEQVIFKTIPCKMIDKYPAGWVLDAQLTLSNFQHINMF